MSVGAIEEIARFYLMGFWDAFYGVYQYCCSESSTDTSADEPSELQIGHLSKLVSIFAWVFFLNVILFGCSDFLLNLLFLGVVRLGLYLTNFIFPISCEYILNTYYPIFSTWFPFLWVIPLFVLSKITNLWWCQDIADITYKSRHKPTSSLSMITSISDLMYTTVFQIIFLIQIYFCYFFFSFIGYVAYLIGMPLLYSMYAFEYKWFYLGMQLHNRLAYIEYNWPYFLGFGSPIAMVTFVIGNGKLGVGLCAFLLLLYIISANYSTPPKATHYYRLPVFSVSGLLTSRFFKLLISWQERT